MSAFRNNRDLCGHMAFLRLRHEILGDKGGPYDYFLRGVPATAPEAVPADSSAGDGGVKRPRGRPKKVRPVE